MFRTKWLGQWLRRLRRPALHGSGLRRLLRLSLGLVIGLSLCLLTHRAVAMAQAARQPVDAVLVLGGSIRREMYAAQLATANPDLPIVISGGSDEPCIWLIFRRNQAPMENLWIEPCARSTLDNYRFGTPVLKQLKAHHVKLVTSGSHQTRAVGLGRTILAGHGMWLSLDAVPEVGRPGNQESKLKTVLDLIRGVGWTVVSQVYEPPCSSLHRLSDIDLAGWDSQSYECEHQGHVEIPPSLEKLGDLNK